MTAIVASLGSAGDLHPFLAVARAWRETGEDVLFLSAEPFRGAVEAEGLRFESILSAHDHHRALKHPDLWHPIRGLGVLWRHMAHRSQDATVAILKRECAKVEPGWRLPVFASPLVLGARLAADVLPLRLSTGHTAPTGLRSCDDPMYIGSHQVPAWTPRAARQTLWRMLDRWKLQPLALPNINRWRKQRGLAELEESVFGRWLQSSDSIICMFDERFCPQASDWPTHADRLGFPLFEPTEEIALSEPLEHFLRTHHDAGQAPLFVYPGSAPTQAASAMREAALRLASAGLPVLWIEAEAVPETRGQLRIERMVSMRQVLPFCKGMLHHGGIGTVAQGMLHELPQWICPSAYDQFENAKRLELLAHRQVRVPQHAQSIMRTVKRQAAEIRLPYQNLRATDHASAAGAPNAAVIRILRALQQQAEHSRSTT